MKISLRERRTAAGTRTLYLDYYERGNRRLEYLRLYLTGNPKEDRKVREIAEQIRSKRVHEDAQGKHGFLIATRQKEDFLAYCGRIAETMRSPNSRMVWKNAMAHLETFAGGPVPFESLSREYLERFRDYLLDRLKPNSAAVYLARIKTALLKAVNTDGILLQNPAHDVKIKKQDTQRAFLTLDELRRLERTPCGNRAVKDAFLFSAFSGLRYSDIRALTWDKVRKAGPHYSIEFVQVKTQEAELLPLSRQAGKILGAQKGTDYSGHITGEIVRNAVFKLPAQQTIDKTVKRWGKRAGISKRISFHTARHTFATLGLTHGVDIYTMSKLLGHRDLSSTQIYAKIVDEKKKKAVELIPTLIR